MAAQQKEVPFHFSLSAEGVVRGCRFVRFGTCVYWTHVCERYKAYEWVCGWLAAAAAINPLLTRSEGALSSVILWHSSHDSRILHIHTADRSTAYIIPPDSTVCFPCLCVCVLMYMSMQHEHELHVCKLWHVSPHVYAYYMSVSPLSPRVWAHLTSLDEIGRLLLANFLSLCNPEWWWGELEAEPELTSWLSAGMEGEERHRRMDKMDPLCLGQEMSLIHSPTESVHGVISVVSMECVFVMSACC